MALTVTDDHAVQERVWAQTGSGWHPNSIRRRLTEADVAVTDKRVRFIGLDSYEAAGGTVKRDLFSDDEDGWIEDATLLDRLASEKLVNRHAKGTPDRHPKGTPFITDYARPVMFLCSADRGCFFVPA